MKLNTKLLFDCIDATHRVVRNEINGLAKEDAELQEVLRLLSQARTKMARIVVRMEHK